MLDKETIDYILDYFSHFMTVKEVAAYKHAITTAKFQKTESWIAKSDATELLHRKNWLSRDDEVLKLLEDGFDQYRVRTAERIFAEHSREIFLNNCPNCGKLARTSTAQQCRHCKHDWHE